MDQEQWHKQLLQEQICAAVKNHYGLWKIFSLTKEGVDLNAIAEREDIIKFVDRGINLGDIVEKNESLLHDAVFSQKLNMNLTPYLIELQLKQAFPSFLQNDVKFITNLIDFSSKYPINYKIEIVVDNELLLIPYRIYLNVDACKSISTTSLSDIQKIIINCIMTRHHNGYIREEFLKRIILCKHSFVVAFVLQLLGEYVVEILNEIYKHLYKLDLALYKEVISNNRKFYDLIKERIISYSTYYYPGKFKYKTDYVGLKILNFFETYIIRT